jgi:hypothetical protein
MATATAPRNDVYLSILAGRVLTALADLAENPAVWSDRIQKELQSGLDYCRAIQAYQTDLPVGGRVERQQALRRLATGDGLEPSAGRPAVGCDDVEALLRDLLDRSREPEPAELLAAIKFFSKDAGR